MNRATFADVVACAEFCAELTRQGIELEVVSNLSGVYTVTFWKEGA